MDKEVLESKVKQLKNLPQYRYKSEVELKDIVRKKEAKAQELANKKAEAELIDVENLFSDIKEKRMARVLLNKYLEEFSLDNISDKALLKDLIYLEVFQKTRLQASAEQFQKENGSVPLQILDSIHKNLDKIRDLKGSLGLTKESSSEKNDAFKAFDLLKKKFKIWAEEHQASRTLKCPFCSKIILLRIRTTAWEEQAHPYFSDKVFGSPHLVKLFKDNKITKEDVALILGVSPDYVSWLCERWDKMKIC